MISISIVLLLQSVIMRMSLTGRTGSFKRPLSAAEEGDAIRRMAEGDSAARDLLIEHNMRLVAHVIKKYYSNSAAEQEDLISIGTVGLIKGIDTYNTGRGIKLVTYVGKCVQNEILMYFRKQRGRSADVSLNDALGVDTDGDPLELIDIIAETEAPDAPETLIELKDTCRRVRKLVDGLQGREREIIRMRYGFGVAPMPQREIAKRLGISRSYVSRIEKKALESLTAQWTIDS
ncbi:RNA polymerase sigma factor [Clostridia bacterium]|nr:RNA polymerase sigma factor [Clostridia bacterium]